MCRGGTCRLRKGGATDRPARKDPPMTATTTVRRRRQPSPAAAGAEPDTDRAWTCAGAFHVEELHEPTRGRPVGPMTPDIAAAWAEEYPAEAPFRPAR